MARTIVPTIVTGDVATAAWGNTYIKDNFAADAAGVAATAGYIIRVTGTNAIEQADPSDGAKLDGDHIDIDFTPTNYTPTTSPSEADDVDDLAAHLAGLDAALVAVAVTEATQANVEAEATGLLYVPPDLVKHSPGVAKVYCTVASDGTLQSNSYNMTSAARDSDGNYTVTFDTDFANDNYAAFAVMEANQLSEGAIHVVTPAVGSISVETYDDAGTPTDKAFHFVAFGDQ